MQLPEVEREVRWPEYVAMARAAGELSRFKADGSTATSPGWAPTAGAMASSSRENAHSILEAKRFMVVSRRSVLSSVLS